MRQASESSTNPRRAKQSSGSSSDILSTGLGGLIVGFALDQLGFQRSAIGQWLVRTLSGEGESIFEGTYAIRARLAGKIGSMAEAYGWGKLLGMVFPWLVGSAGPARLPLLLADP
jgi:hypothetical protein